MSACYAFKERLSETITIHTPGGICEVTQQNWSIKGSVFKILEGEIDLESFPEN
jgi:diaminopimelate epimerase